jgi:hypothetical protein
MTITGNYTLNINPDWKQVQLDEVYLECDTSGGPVTIQLFEIVGLLGFPNIKLYVSDISGNASNNNITVTAGGSDLIDSSNSVVIDTNNGIEVMAIVNEKQWIAISSETGGPVGPPVVNYANTFCVDQFHGGRTGIQGRFDSPWFSISDAISSAVLTNPTSTNRAIIWVRSGTYVNQNITLRDNIDIYCEPGVIFTGACLINDFSGAVNVNWYGSAIWNCTYSTLVFQVNFASTILFEGNTFYNTGGCGGSLNNDPTPSNVTYSFNSIESATGNGTGFMFTWRGICNATVNVKEFLKCGHEHHDIRSGHSGNVVVNCPRNIATSNNQYGGNFSQIINGSGGTDSSFIEINGNIEMTEPFNRAGIQSVVVLFGGNSTVVRINGNITFGDMPCFYIVANGNTPNVIHNGSITGNRTISIIGENSSLKVMNGSATLLFPLSENNQNYTFSNNSGGTLVLQNVLAYNNNSNKAIVQQDNLASKLYMFNVMAEIRGNAEGNALVSSTTPGAEGTFAGVISNFGLATNVSNVLSSGLTVDPNLQVPINNN